MIFKTNVYNGIKVLPGSGDLTEYGAIMLSAIGHVSLSWDEISKSKVSLFPSKTTSMRLFFAQGDE